MHYLTAPNMVQLDRSNKAPGLQNSGCMLAFSPHRYRCCQHNAGIGWPQYAVHLWMATQDNGLALMQYAANTVTTTVADGVEVTAEVRTDFPFSDTVGIEVSPKKAAEFPIYLRVPAWCKGAKLTLNGQPQPSTADGPGYLRVLRAWSPGDKVVLTLPMAVDVSTWRTHRDAVSVRRGPLWYSLKVGERWERRKQLEDQLRHVMDCWGGRPYIVGVADQVPPNGEIDFCRRIADFVSR